MKRLMPRILLAIFALLIAFPALAQDDEKAERHAFLAQRLERLEAILIELQPVADDSHPRLAEILEGSRELLDKGRFDELEGRLVRGEAFVGIDEHGSRIELHEPWYPDLPLGQIDVERFREDFMRDVEDFRRHLEELSGEGFEVEEFIRALEGIEPEDDLLLEHQWERLGEMREELHRMIEHHEMEHHELTEQIERQRHRFSELLEISMRLNNIGEMERAREMLQMAMDSLNEQTFLMEMRDIPPNERPFHEIGRDLDALRDHAMHLDEMGAKVKHLNELIEKVEAMLDKDELDGAFEALEMAWREVEEL